MNINVQISQSLEQKLDARYDEVLSDALNEVTDQLARDMQMEAPVDTGYLQSSIAAETGGTTQKSVTCGAEYWVYVNYGTYKMAANPFVDRAIANMVSTGTIDTAIMNALRAHSII